MFNVKVDMGNIVKKVDGAFGYGQFFLDEVALKDSNYYAPEDKGFSGGLMGSAVLHSKIGKGELVWQTPYARRLYYNPQFQFSTDKNPNAQGLWFEAAKAEKLKSWLDQTEKAVRKKL